MNREDKIKSLHDYRKGKITADELWVSENDTYDYQKMTEQQLERIIEIGKRLGEKCLSENTNGLSEDEIIFIESLPIKSKSNTAFFNHANGVYVNTQTGKTLTEDEFKNRHQNGFEEKRTVVFKDYSQGKK